MVRSSFLVRFVGVMGFAALGGLPACSGEVVQNTGGGGSGAEGGTGGGGTTTSGSEGGGTTASTTTSEGCSPACDEHSACLEGQCEPVRIATLTAWRLTLNGLNDFFAELGRVSVCEARSTTFAPSPILAEEGDCKAVGPSAPLDDEEPAGLSEVVAKAPSFGTLTLAGSLACKDSDVGLTPAYLDGETVTFEVAAGEHNPAFTMEAKSPPALTLTTGSLYQAEPQPLEITWESEGTPQTILLHDAETDLAIVCTPPGGSSVVIGTSLTSLLPLGNKTWTAIAILRGEENKLELSPTYRARAFAVRYAYVEVPSFQ